MSVLPAAAVGVPALLKTDPLSAKESASKGEGFTFLFQGDSITDGNRTRDNDWNHVMGHGYAYLIASRLWYDFPEKRFHFFNRGISGNKITDLQDRWDQDTVALKPDLLSILIGINDVSTFLGGNAGFSVEQYELGYRSLLDETRKKLPAIQFVLCEPFMMPGARVNNKLAEYEAEVKKRQVIVKRLADDYKAIFVGFQQAFNKALSKAPVDYWIWDGVHPMPAGHELMAREWIKEVSRQLTFIQK